MNQLSQHEINYISAGSFLNLPLKGIIGASINLIKKLMPGAKKTDYINVDVEMGNRREPIQ